jgi:hypothetical protein
MGGGGGIIKAVISIAAPELAPFIAAETMVEGIAEGNPIQAISGAMGMGGFGGFEGVDSSGFGADFGSAGWEGAGFDGSSVFDSSGFGSDFGTGGDVTSSFGSSDIPSEVYQSYNLNPQIGELSQALNTNSASYNPDVANWVGDTSRGLDNMFNQGADVFRDTSAISGGLGTGLQSPFNSPTFQDTADTLTAGSDTPFNNTGLTQFGGDQGSQVVQTQGSTLENVGGEKPLDLGAAPEWNKDVSNWDDNAAQTRWDAEQWAKGKGSNMDLGSLWDRGTDWVSNNPWSVVKGVSAGVDYLQAQKAQRQLQDMFKQSMSQADPFSGVRGTASNAWTQAVENPDALWQRYMAGEGGKDMAAAAALYSKSGKRNNMLPALQSQMRQNFMANYLPKFMDQVNPSRFPSGASGVAAAYAPALATMTQNRFAPITHGLQTIFGKPNEVKV